MTDNLSPEQRQALYDSIARVQDDYTRRQLYREFVMTYYPEAYAIITGAEQ